MTAQATVPAAPEERTWELIVKYTGDLERIASENIQVTRLLNEYAILVVPESLIG